MGSVPYLSRWEFRNWPLEKAAVSQRGWTFQERLWAPAVLHYGSRHIIWECHTHSITEDGYESLADPLLKALTWGQNSFFNSIIRDESQRGLHESWYRLVEEYSLRNLTFASDKLLALDGIAMVYRERLGARYLSGLWADNLPAGLLWKAATHFSETAAYRAPSWSWMALDGKLFHIGKHFNESRRINRNLDMRILRTFDDTDASGEDCD